ncbi:hypothetical protein JVX93_09870 [Mycolicibacterium boenickei]|nr:hypothetical protein JVX93_09870 [Mycolicibacterium boenickei]
MSIADIDIWNADSISAVGAASTARANAASQASTSLGGLSAFEKWQGSAAAAAQQRTRAHADGLDQHRRGASAVTQAANTAANEVRQVKSQLGELRSTLGRYGITVDANGSQVVPPKNLSSLPQASRKLVQDMSKTGQQALDRIRQAADQADNLLSDALKTTEEKPKKIAGGEKKSTRDSDNADKKDKDGKEKDPKSKSGRTRGVEFASFGRGAPLKDNPQKPPPDDNKDEKDTKKDGDKGSRSHSRSFGKGGEIKPTGPLEKKWGTDTDPHRTGEPRTVDLGGNNSLTYEGPGRQGGASAEKHEDGYAGQSNGDAWLTKGTFHLEPSIAGHTIPIDGAFELGAHHSETGAITDHGFSEGLDAFMGGEISAKSPEFNLGPLDLSLGASAQVGVGASEHLSIGEQDGKYVIGGDIGIAWGFGAKISPHISIDKSYVDNAIGSLTGSLDRLF